MEVIGRGNFTMTPDQMVKDLEIGDRGEGRNQDHGDTYQPVVSRGCRGEMSLHLWLTWPMAKL